MKFRNLGKRRIALTFVTFPLAKYIVVLFALLFVCEFYFLSPQAHSSNGQSFWEFMGEPRIHVSAFLGLIFVAAVSVSFHRLEIDLYRSVVEYERNRVDDAHEAFFDLKILSSLEAKPTNWLLGRSLVFHFAGGEEIRLTTDSPPWLTFGKTDFNAIGQQVADFAGVNFKPAPR